jgi:hypothetical protein
MREKNSSSRQPPPLMIWPRAPGHFLWPGQGPRGLRPAPPLFDSAEMYQSLTHSGTLPVRSQSPSAEMPLGRLQTGRVNGLAAGRSTAQDSGFSSVIVTACSQPGVAGLKPQGKTRPSAADLQVLVVALQLGIPCAGSQRALAGLVFGPNPLAGPQRVLGVDPRRRREPRSVSTADSLVPNPSGVWERSVRVSRENAPHFLKVELFRLAFMLVGSDWNRI